AAKPATGTGNSISIEELDLPTRIANALQKAGFETVSDLLATTSDELAKVKNVGSKSVKLIEAALAQRGISLS
ncbi:MAG: DNA-directed RNA polymerase subunit alpha C-terminal domain-containing protein, partial [Patescibacteria group bacterium]